jgi:hypothetical protein
VINQGPGITDSVLAVGAAAGLVPAGAIHEQHQPYPSTNHSSFIIHHSSFIIHHSSFSTSQMMLSRSATVKSAGRTIEMSTRDRRKTRVSYGKEIQRLKNTTPPHHTREISHKHNGRVEEGGAP